MGVSVVRSADTINIPDQKTLLRGSLDKLANQDQKQSFEFQIFKIGYLLSQVSNFFTGLI